MKKKGWLHTSANCKNCLQTLWLLNEMEIYVSTKQKQTMVGPQKCVRFSSAPSYQCNLKKKLSLRVNRGTQLGQGVTLRKGFRAWRPGEPPTHGPTAWDTVGSILMSSCAGWGCSRSREGEANNRQNGPYGLPLCVAGNSWFSMCFFRLQRPRKGMGGGPICPGLDS